MSKLNYDYAECRELAKNAKRSEIGFPDAVKYFHERVFYTDEGSIYAYKEGKLKMYTFGEFHETQMVGFPLQLKKEIESAVKPYKEVLERSNYEVDSKARKINVFKPLYAATLTNIKSTKG